MSGAWTPGPWTADGPPWNRIVWSSAENRVCFMAHTNGLDDDRDIATSNLIAAAPDLYAALELILPLAKGYVANNNVGNNRAFIAQAEAALAKARGEA